MSIEYRQYSYASQEHKKARILRYCILRLGNGISDECVQDVYGDDSREKNHILLGAFEDDLLVGTVNLAPWGENCLLLNALAIHDSRQGEGIGAKLVKYAHKVAKEQGYCSIRLMGRSNVVEFYKKLGYTLTGVVENHPQVILMEMTVDL